MVRQLRIDRFNGMEILVCEVYHKHLFTQTEYEMYEKYCAENGFVSQADFRALVDEALDQEGADSAFGLSYPIPVFDYTPALILRGAVVLSRIASLQVDYIDSVTHLEVLDEVKRFYDVVREPHWRSAVSRQIQRYGSLFESD